MNYLDIILGSLILYGAVKGFFKGLIIEAASLVALIAGIVGALLLATSVSDLLTTFLILTQFHQLASSLSSFLLSLSF